MGLCFVSFAFEACLYCPRAEHILYLFAAPTINHNSAALRVCDSDRTADEDTEQIELFVITAYPNTRMPAIIRQHREWQVENGIPPSALLFYWIFPSFFLLTAFILKVSESSSCIDSRRSQRRGQNKNRKDEVRVKGGTSWHADSER